MSNPLRILQTLDRYLQASAELTLFGRSALALGYSDVPQHFHSTRDVDGILPLAWLEAEDSHEDFWLSLQRTNLELESAGLYVTHLFRELDVILQPDWFPRRVSLNLGLSKLAIFRPGTIDLILTKMARCDDEDLQDIRFLLKQETLTAKQLAAAFQRARVPNVPEIQQLFVKAQPRVLALLEVIPGNES